MKTFQSSVIIFLSIMVLSLCTMACDNTGSSNNTYDLSTLQDESTNATTEQDQSSEDTAQEQEQTTTDIPEYPGYIKGFIVEVDENWLLFKTDDGELYQINCPSGKFEWFENKLHWKFKVYGNITDEIDEETDAIVFEIEWFALDTAYPETFAFGHDYDYPVTVTGTLKYSEFDGWKYFEFYGDDGIGYLITNIPEEFKVDGIRVGVTFHFPLSPCSAIMWGFEVVQSKIELLEES